MSTSPRSATKRVVPWSRTVTSRGFVGSIASGLLRSKGLGPEPIGRPAGAGPAPPGLPRWFGRAHKPAHQYGLYQRPNDPMALRLSVVPYAPERRLPHREHGCRAPPGPDGLR